MPSYEHRLTRRLSALQTEEREGYTSTVRCLNAGHEIRTLKATLAEIAWRRVNTPVQLGSAA